MKNRTNDHANDFIDYQNHIYNPHHCSNDNSPTVLKYDRREIIKCLLYIAGGFIFLMILFVTFLEGFTTDDIIEIILVAFLIGGLCILFITIGIRLIIKSKKS